MTQSGHRRLMDLPSPIRGEAGLIRVDS